MYTWNQTAVPIAAHGFVAANQMYGYATPQPTAFPQIQQSTLAAVHAVNPAPLPSKPPEDRPPLPSEPPPDVITIYNKFSVLFQRAQTFFY